MSILFQPINIGQKEPFTVKNRFVRSATHDFLGNEDGSISNIEIELYKTLAIKDVGLIITGHAYVQHPLGRASVRQNALYDDRFIEGYRKLANVVHEHGSKLVLQISHAGRQSFSLVMEGLTPTAPSAVTDNSTGVTPRALREDEIWKLVEDYAKAMFRAKEAGCDGVQLDVCHGYLLSEFISPYTNRREDQWGGTIENRTRILKEIIVRGKILLGENYPILVKLNSTDGFEGPGYLTREDVLFTAKLLDNLGIAAIEVSGGIQEAEKGYARPNILSPEQEAYFADASRAIKAVVNCTVILSGGLRSLDIMESMITEGVADMVSLSRPFIREPDLVTRFQSGHKQSACVSCNACFNPKGLKCYYHDKKK